MKNKMSEFITWLETDLTNFVSLIEEGSTVTGDPWQEGYSDHDLTIIVTHDTDNEMIAVAKYLKQNPFDNSYLFGPRIEEEFVVGNNLNDISMKFRAKAIAGKDLISEKAFPDQKAALKIGQTGLKGLEMRCIRRLLNLSHWTLDYTQEKNYEIFKNFFVFSAAAIYGETGEYPTKREDVAEILAVKFDARKLLQVTNHIASATKADQEEALRSAIEYIKKQ